MIAETQLRAIGCAVALNSETKQIIFNRHLKAPAFMDHREGLPTATWGNLLELGEKSFSYNTWYSLDDEEVLKAYFKSVIDSDYQPPIHFNFQQG